MADTSTVFFYLVLDSVAGFAETFALVSVLGFAALAFASALGLAAALALAAAFAFAAALGKR